MAEFRKIVTTDKGQALLAKTLTGQEKITFTKISFSETEYSDAEIRELTVLNGTKQTTDNITVSKKTETSVKVQGVITNESLTDGYFVRTVALHAKDTDETEIIYAACSTTSPDWMPAVGGASISGTSIKLIINVSDISNVTLAVDSAGHATIDDFIHLQSQIADLDKLMKKYVSVLKMVSADGAPQHNAIYRGKNLGTSVTQEQYAVIADGSFKEMYIGDYWTINGRVYRIAAFDYYYNAGDTNCTTHHVIIVPDRNLGVAQMNSTGDTARAYIGSNMYKTNLNTVKNTITSDFSGHLMTHRKLFSNSTSNGMASGWEWVNSSIDIMNEVQVYGTSVWGVSSAGGAGGSNIGVDCVQFPLFALHPSMIRIREAYWLRDVCNSQCFTYVNSSGSADYINASIQIGIRPSFAIKA